MAGIEEYFNLPEDALLNKKVHKKLFSEHGDLSAADRKILKEVAENINWYAVLKPDNIKIPAYSDESSEYNELSILIVTLAKQVSINRLSEIIHRTIPYPLLVVFRFENFDVLSAAPKRFSQASSEALVVEAFYDTGWIDMSNSSELVNVFLGSIHNASLNQQNLKKWYRSVVDRILTYNISLHTGHYSIIEGTAAEHAEIRLSELMQLENRLAEIRKIIKKEERLNRRIELNVALKGIEEEYRKLLADA